MSEVVVHVVESGLVIRDRADALAGVMTLNSSSESAKRQRIKIL